MLNVIILQCTALVVVSMVAGLMVGVPGFFSALLGGLCCVVPNALFALRLFVATQVSKSVSPMTFFIGEFVKIGLTVAALTATVFLYRDVNVLALVAAFIVVLKSYIILLFRY